MPRAHTLCLIDVKLLLQQASPGSAAAAFAKFHVETKNVVSGQRQFRLPSMRRTNPLFEEEGGDGMEQGVRAVSVSCDTRENDPVRAL